MSSAPQLLKRHASRFAAACLALGAAAAAAPALAAAGAIDLTLSGGYTVVVQSADDRRIDDEATGSADLRLAVARGRGTLEVWVEGATTPRRRGVATVLPEANADAGTALARDGDGRVQLSELKYTIELAGDGSVAFGLIDVTAYLDTTRIDNDENMQFLGTSFLNNPAVEFPDYAPGVVLERSATDRWPRIRLALAGSHGLADNPDRSYGEVFDVTDRGRGLFAGVEFDHLTPRGEYRIGAWTDTASHARLRDGGPGGSSFGAYAVIGRSFGRHGTSFRLGLANPEVSPAAAFASVSYQRQWQRLVLGTGAAWIKASDEIPAPATDDIAQFEVYLRIEVAGGLYLTPAVQQIVHSGFDASGLRHDERVVVASLRLHQAF